jgi:beta-1,4-N-acetylglucosaminyltransferase
MAAEDHAAWLGRRFALVTVGTTSFDALVRAVCSREAVQVLRDVHGVTGVMLQIGRGDFVPPGVEGPLEREEMRQIELHGMRFVLFRFRPTLADLLPKCSLVISHAGAGSIFESLGAGKPLMVVVNDALMENHQWEIADAMRDAKHCAAVSATDLVSGLRDFKPADLLPLPPADLGPVRAILAEELA